MAVEINGFIPNLSQDTMTPLSATRIWHCRGQTWVPQAADAKHLDQPMD